MTMMPIQNQIQKCGFVNIKCLIDCPALVITEKYSYKIKKNMQRMLLNKVWFEDMNTVSEM